MASTQERSVFDGGGRVWSYTYFKGDARRGELINPDGNRIETDQAPFTLHPRDGHFILPIGATAVAGARKLSATEGRPADAVRGYLYVLDIANQDYIRVFDVNTRSLQASIAISALPIGMAVSGDGRWVYVTHVATSLPNRISVIDTTTRTIVQTINLPATVAPGDPVVSPDGRILYVPNKGRFVPPQGYLDSSVILIDTARRQVVGEIPLNEPGPPLGINKMAITPDGVLLFAVPTQGLSARLFVIDTVHREVVATTGLLFRREPSGATVFDSFRDLLLDRSGTRLYLLTDDSVVVFDTATVTEVARILVRANGRLNRLALSLDGGSLFVNAEFLPLVFRIDTASNRLEEEIRTGQNNRDSSMIFVTP